MQCCVGDIRICRKPSKATFVFSRSVDFMRAGLLPSENGFNPAQLTYRVVVDM